MKWVQRFTFEVGRLLEAARRELIEEDNVWGCNCVWDCVAIVQTWKEFKVVRVELIFGVVWRDVF